MCLEANKFKKSCAQKGREIFLSSLLFFCFCFEIRPDYTSSVCKEICFRGYNKKSSHLITEIGLTFT